LEAHISIASEPTLLLGLITERTDEGLDLYGTMNVLGQAHVHRVAHGLKGRSGSSVGIAFRSCEDHSHDLWPSSEDSDEFARVLLDLVHGLSALLVGWVFAADPDIFVDISLSFATDIVILYDTHDASGNL
jgi:hypothetical protein